MEENTETTSTAVVETDEPVSEVTETSTKDIVADVDDQAEFEQFQKLAKEHGQDTDEPLHFEQTDITPTEEDAEAEPEPDIPEPAEPEKSDSKEKAEGTEPEGLDEALSAWKRDGVFNEEEIEKLYRDDPSIFIDKGQKLAKRQKDQDRFSSEFGQLKAKVESGDAPKGEASEETEQTSISEEADAILARIAGDDLIGEEVANDIKSLVSAMTRENTDQLKALLEEKDQQNQALQQGQVEQAIAMSRMRHAQKYESLNENETYEKVMRTFSVLAESGAYETVENCFDAAVKQELGEQSTTELKERLLKTNKGRRKGQPRASSPSSPNKAMSREDKDYKTFLEVARKHGEMG
jgi:hypothetical protein